jgi:hypothetical protein
VKLTSLVPLALLTLSLAPACSSLPPERQLVADAAEALGGRSAVEDLTSLRLEGAGTAYLLGQNLLPDTDLPTYKVTDYVRTIDLGAGRTATQQTRTAQFAFAGNLVTRPHVGLDNDVAYNVGADGRVTRAGDRDARDRRIDMLHHPVTIVRAALDPAATVANLRQQGDDEIVDVTTAKGDRLTLAVNRTTKLPSRVQSKAAHPNLGDVTITTAFANYQDVSGVKLPARLVTTTEDYPQLTIDVSKNEVNVDATGLAAPDAVKAAAPPTPPAAVVTVEPVGKGIWWLAGSGNHRSIVFEFDDHLTLFEVPVSEARSKAVIDKARTLSTKPLTHAIVSHHHFDHSGGLRVAVAEGLTVITHRLNEPFFKMLVARPFTIEPDALARAPRPLTLQLVDDTLTLEDSSMEVQLYHLRDNPREGTNLYAYVPRDRMLVQADLYDNTWLRHLWGENVLTNLEQRKLVIDRHVPVHGARESFADMVKTIKAKAST